MAAADAGDSSGLRARKPAAESTESDANTNSSTNTIVKEGVCCLSVGCFDMFHRGHLTLF